MNYQGQAINVSMQDGIAELQFDLKNESVNKFNTLTLGELKEVVDNLKGAIGVKGLLLTSAKNVFVVGADITEFTEWFDVPAPDLTKHVLDIHRVFSALEDLPFPTVMTGEQRQIALQTVSEWIDRLEELRRLPPDEQ